MAVFVGAGRGRLKGDARKAISGAVRGSPGRAVQAGIRGIELRAKLRINVQKKLAQKRVILSLTIILHR